MDQQELADRKEIEALRIAYCAHYDAQELDPLVELFTPDAVLHFPETYGGDWIGQDGIREGFSKWVYAVGEPYDTVHMVTNPFIELTGPDTASGRWYLLDYLTRQNESVITTPGGHDQPLLLIGLYEDRYRKVDGRWKIARSRLSPLWPARSYTGPLAD